MIEEVPESELPTVRYQELVIVVVKLEGLTSVSLELKQALLADEVILVHLPANSNEHKSHVDL